MLQAIKRMKDEVSRDHPDCSVNVDQMQLDLSSFRSTKQFTVEFKERALPLHILINNAGIGMPPHSMWTHTHIHTHTHTRTHYNVVTHLHTAGV